MQRGLGKVALLGQDRAALLEHVRELVRLLGMDG